MKKVAVILSGCGYLDGTEITEAVSTLIAIGQQGAEYQIFSLDKDVPETDHLTKQPTGHTRNMLHESARIARGEIQTLDTLTAQDFDALAFPGGFGAATHLCNFAEQGAAAHMDPEVQRVLTEFHAARKPIAAICIAPALMALAFGKEGVQLTIGNDQATAAELEKTGAKHATCDVQHFVVDDAKKVITTPAYMYGTAKPHEIFQGVSGAIRALLELV